MDDEAITGWAVAAQQGDRDAAASFIRATTAALRRLLSYLGDPHHVDDLVQETYLRAFTALPRYAGKAPARLWLFSIARRVAADQVRTAQRRPRTSGADWEHQLDQRRAAPAPSGWVEVRQAIAALEPERREAFVLTRVLGLSYAEAAEACDCPVGTIRSRVFRARTDLLAALAERDDDDAASGS
ncbi:MAG: sigma-70 family RNA polymerase sigma factor [Sciscionella sp.]